MIHKLTEQNLVRKLSCCCTQYNTVLGIPLFSKSLLLLNEYCMVLLSYDAMIGIGLTHLSDTLIIIIMPCILSVLLCTDR